MYKTDNTFDQLVTPDRAKRNSDRRKLSLERAIQALTEKGVAENSLLEQTPKFNCSSGGSSRLFPTSGKKSGKRLSPEDLLQAELQSNGTSAYEHSCEYEMSEWPMSRNTFTPCGFAAFPVSGKEVE